MPNKKLTVMATKNLQKWLNDEPNSAQEMLESVVEEMKKYEEIPQGKERYEAFSKRSEMCISMALSNPVGHDAKVSCKAGCSMCCYQPVEIKKSEGMVLFDRIKEDLSRFPIHNLKKQAEAKTMGEFYKLPYQLRKCVFLGNDGLCQVYDIRPLMCRGYLSVDDPEKCNTEFVTRDIARTICLGHEKTASAIQSIPSEEPKKKGMGTIPDVLVTMFEEYFGKKKARKLLKSPG